MSCAPTEVTSKTVESARAQGVVPPKLFMTSFSECGAIKDGSSPPRGLDPLPVGRVHRGANLREDSPLPPRSQVRVFQQVPSDPQPRSFLRRLRRSTHHPQNPRHKAQTANVRQMHDGRCMSSPGSIHAKPTCPPPSCTDGTSRQPQSQPR